MEKVLIIDDLPEKGVELEEELKKQNIKTIYFAQCYIEAIKSIEEREYDLIILDMTLPRERIRGSKLDTYVGKSVLFDMLSMKKFIPSIVVTRYTYFGDEIESDRSHTSNFCLENIYYMKEREEIIEVKFDISTYSGLHKLFSLKIPFYVGMIYYNPNEDIWKENLKKFLQKIKEIHNEYIGNGRYR